jgi:GxxExxY protein
LETERLAREVLSSAMEVHRQLGPGLLPSAYEVCLCHELYLHGVSFVRRRILPLSYKGLQLDCCYRIDLVVEDKILVELKSIEQVLPIHSAQLLTYLRASKKPIGLLINFNVLLIKDGITRIVNGLEE